MRRRVTIRRFYAGQIAAWLTVISGFGQAVQVPAPALLSNFINPGHLSSPVRGLALGFGKRILLPGNERTTLTGTYSAQGVTSALATITWEVPGRLRFDRSDQPGNPLIFDDVTGVNLGSKLSQPDANILETLFDDSPQTFFYLMNQGVSYRFLGGNFRLDDGTATNYTGPLHELFDVFSNARGQIGTPKRLKRYRFDREAQLLTRVEYYTTPTNRVITDYSGWTKLNGQAVPGQIVRTEGATVVFSLRITASTIGPSVSDGVFPGH